MTVQDVINQADERVPNVIPQSEKIKMVAEAEAVEKLFREQRKESHPRELSLDTELDIQFPWDAMYFHWVEAWIHFYQGETERYNQAIAIFNSWHSKYQDYCRQIQLPEKKNIQYL